MHYMTEKSRILFRSCNPVFTGLIRGLGVFTRLIRDSPKNTMFRSKCFSSDREREEESEIEKD